ALLLPLAPFKVAIPVGGIDGGFWRDSQVTDPLRAGCRWPVIRALDHGFLAAYSAAFRASVPEALSWLGEPRPVADLKEIALRGASVGARADACVTLGFCRGDGIRELLGTLLDDPEAAVRCAALASASLQGSLPGVADPLWERIR